MGIVILAIITIIAAAYGGNLRSELRKSGYLEGITQRCGSFGDFSLFAMWLARVWS